MSPRRDVSDAVRALLLPALADRVREAEAVLHHPVTFYEDTSLPAGAGGSASPDGVIRLASGCVENLSVIGEEIMHVYRWTSGFPAIEPAHYAVIHDYSGALLRLGGHFDEYAFFPFLEALNLNPRAEVVPTLTPQMQAIESRLADIRSVGETAYWRTVLSTMFVQAQVIAPNCAERDAFLAVFQRAELAPHATLGRTLCDEITGAARQTPVEVEVRMLRCIREHLQLNDRAAHVRRFY